MWGELHLISVQDACIKKDLFHFLKDNRWMEEDDILRIYSFKTVITILF